MPDPLRNCWGVAELFVVKWARTWALHLGKWLVECQITAQVPVDGGSGEGR
jgi:hypothetical protein